MVISDRTKGCCSIELNEPPHPDHDQFAELDAHNLTLEALIGCGCEPARATAVQHLRGVCSSLTRQRSRFAGRATAALPCSFFSLGPSDTSRTDQSRLIDQFGNGS